MTAEVAPPRGEPAAAALPRRSWLALAAAALLWSLLFYRTLVFGGALRAHDWQSHHFHYFDWVRTSLTQHHTLPLYMFHAWITPNFLANAEAPQLGPLVWLLCFLSTDAYLKLLLVLFTAAGLLGSFALLRDLRVGAPVAATAAVVFAFNGFFVAHICVGHPWSMGAQLLPGLLCLYRRAALGSDAALAGAAGLLAATILGGQHQPFVWQHLFLGGFAALWALRVRAAFPLLRFALLALATAGLAAVKLLPMAVEFADYAPAQHTMGFPLHVLPGALLASGRHAESAVPGLDYLHGSGWWEWSFRLGPLACAWLLAGLVAARRCWTLVAIGAAFLVLALDTPLWPLLRELPLWRTQRSPSRFLLLALLPFAVAAAVGWQRSFEAARARWPRAALAAALAVALFAAVGLERESRAWQRAAVGAPLAPRDHRPQPLRIDGAAGTRAELVGFEPNRFTYRATSPRGGLVVLPLRYREGSDAWSAAGLPVISQKGKLAVDVPSGERDIVMTYRPRHFAVGAAISAASLLALVGLLWRGRMRAPG